MRRLLHASLAGVLLVGTTGCLAISAKSAPLNVPEPPSRVVTPPSMPVEPPPAAAPPTTPPPPPQPVTGGSSTSAPPTTTSVRPPQNTNPALPASPPPVETPVLTTNDAAELANLDRQILANLDNAKRDLDKVDRRQLSKDSQEQYDSARRLYDAAVEARRVKNLSLAFQHSAKAALMAGLLVKSIFTSPTFP